MEQKLIEYIKDKVRNKLLTTDQAHEMISTYHRRMDDGWDSEEDIVNEIKQLKLNAKTTKS